MACSTSSTNCWKYDVFLSFRGKDTRYTFTSHLRHALSNKGINFFVDDMLLRGKELSPALLQVIEDSRISIVVFSKNYANSSYCLDELVKIVQCKESMGQVVFPVFYNVDPSHVEEHEGSFGDALRVHAVARRKNLQEWKQALTKAARLSGWHLDNGDEAKTIQMIVEEVFIVLNRIYLHVADYPVGLDSHIHDMNHNLSIGSSNDVRMVGIWGIGGIGKTTVAKAVYNRIAILFEGSCFLANVRDTSKKYSVVQLQETLLFEILGDKKILMGNFDLGVQVIRERLCSKKVLIVIDDVDNEDQLKKLAGELDWFGPGSRIIITTRDEHLLLSHGVKIIHKVDQLCLSDALLLFSWKAFRQPQPSEGFGELSHYVVKYTKGLPLALVVLGSFLYGRSVHEWESELDKLKQNPNKQICEILQISYDGLEHNEKAIFLDVACFFRGMDKDHAIKILHACNLNPVIGIKVLIEKSLISIENNKLQMHDLLQAMGRQVVQQECPNIPSRRSRLWYHEDILPVLTENMGTDEIEGIMLDLREPEEIHLNAKAFEKMKRLRILIIRNALLTVGPVNLPNELRWLEWPGCPLSSMPPTFQARKLVLLNMQRSFIRQFEGFKNYKYLKFMDFRDCEFLKETPDFSTIPNLERLNVESCTNLVVVHESVGCLDKLEFLSFEFCYNLRSLPSIFKLKSLETLLLTGCKKLEAFPDIVVEMRFLKKLCLTGTAIAMLPSSIKNITGLKVLTVTYCKNLTNLPSTLYMLKHLECLLLEGCSKLRKFPVNVQNELQSNSLMSSNDYASSSGSDFPLALGDFLCRPSSCGFLMLSWLDLQSCNLTDVDFLKIPSCFPMLKELELSGNNFVILPPIFSAFTRLKSLKLSDCKKLQEIPELPLNIKSLAARDCQLLVRLRQLETEKERPTRLRFVDFSNCHKLAEKERQTLERTLLNKGILKKFRVELVLPRTMIPEWCTYSSEKGSLIFQLPLSAYEKIKGLVFCTILCLEDGVTANVSCEFAVDGQSMISCSRQFVSLQSDHMWLYHHPYGCTRTLNPGRIDSVRFEISFEVLGAPTGSGLKRCGVYVVFKQDKTVNHQSTTGYTQDMRSYHQITTGYTQGKTVNHQITSGSTSHHTESVSLDLMRSCYNYPLELNLNPNINGERRADDLNQNINGEIRADDPWGKQLSLSLQPMDQNKSDPLLASKSGEHRQEQWLSLSWQPMDRINWDPLCFEELNDEVQLKPKKQKMNSLDELGRKLISEHAEIHDEVEANKTSISDANSHVEKQNHS